MFAIDERLRQWNSTILGNGSVTVLKSVTIASRVPNSRRNPEKFGNQKANCNHMRLLLTNGGGGGESQYYYRQ